MMQIHYSSAKQAYCFLRDSAKPVRLMDGDCQFIEWFGAYEEACDVARANGYWMDSDFAREH